MAFTLSMGQLSSTTADIYTLSASETAEIKEVRFFNSGSAVNTVSLYVYEYSSGDEWQIAQEDIPPSGSYRVQFDYPLTLNETDDAIRADATNANEVNFFVLGRGPANAGGGGY